MRCQADCGHVWKGVLPSRRSLEGLTDETVIPGALQLGRGRPLARLIDDDPEGFFGGLSSTLPRQIDRPGQMHDETVNLMLADSAVLLPSLQGI